MKWVANQSFGGRSLLQFGDDSRAVLGNTGQPIANPTRAMFLRAFLQLRNVGVATGFGNATAGTGNELFQGVWHAVFSVYRRG